MAEKQGAAQGKEHTMAEKQGAAQGKEHTMAEKQGAGTPYDRRARASRGKGHAMTGEQEQEQKKLETLECYQLAQQVLKEAYALAKQLPDVEKYNLCDQIRRASTSGVLNIAEGYGRYHYLDRIRFFYNARGSLSEVLGAVEASETLGYIGRDECTRLQQLVNGALRSLNGFIRHVRQTQQGQKEFGTRLVREDGPAHVISADDP